MDISNLSKCCAVCKRWCYLTKHDKYWKHLATIPGKIKTSTSRFSFFFSPSPSDNFPSRYAVTLPLSCSGNEWKKLMQDLGNNLPRQVLHNGSSMINRGVFESTRDCLTQGIANTLVDDYVSFWSSKGSNDPNSVEILEFFLSDHALIGAIEICVYQANWQEGFPIYAPQFVQFSTSFTQGEKDIHWKSEKFLCKNIPEPQIFKFPTQLIVGSFLRITLIGRCTKQPGDNLYYTVLRLVKCIGIPVNKLTDRPFLSKTLQCFAKTQIMRT